MRTWLLPSLLKNLGMSTNDTLPQNVFELDMVFKVKDRKAIESYHLAAVSIDTNTNFNDIKAVVGGLMAALGIDFTISEFKHATFIEGRCAEIMVDGKSVGFFGELHPKVLKNFGIEEPGTAFEIDLEKLAAKD